MKSRGSKGNAGACFATQPSAELLQSIQLSFAIPSHRAGCNRAGCRCHRAGRRQAKKQATLMPAASAGAGDRMGNRSPIARRSPSASSGARLDREVDDRAASAHSGRPSPSRASPSPSWQVNRGRSTASNTEAWLKELHRGRSMTPRWVRHGSEDESS